MSVLYCLGYGLNYDIESIEYSYGTRDSDGSWNLRPMDLLGNEFYSNGGIWTLAEIEQVMRIGARKNSTMSIIYVRENKAIDTRTRKIIELGYDDDPGRELRRKLLEKMGLSPRAMQATNQEVGYKSSPDGRVLFSIYGFEDSTSQDSIIHILTTLKPQFKVSVIGIKFYKAITIVKTWYGARRGEDIMIKKIVLE